MRERERKKSDIARQKKEGGRGTRSESELERTENERGAGGRRGSWPVAVSVTETAEGLPVAFSLSFSYTLISLPFSNRTGMR